MGQNIAKDIEKWMRQLTNEEDVHQSQQRSEDLRRMQQRRIFGMN